MSTAGEAPRPSKRRRRPIRIRSLMAAVAALALVLGYGTWIARGVGRISDANARIGAWCARIGAEDPTLARGLWRIRTNFAIVGFDSVVELEFRTPTGHPIAVRAVACPRPFGPDRRVLVWSEGRSLSWPIAEVLWGRAIDLRAEFPGASR